MNRHVDHKPDHNSSTSPADLNCRADVSGESSVNQRARPEKEARGRDRRYEQGQRAQIKGQGQRVQAGTEGTDKGRDRSPSLPHSQRPSHASPVPALATPLPALDFALNPVVHNNRHSCSLSHPPPP
ncbi:hypothetical protein Pcinc_042766 [Petrolisthes cinctipes]|uniref:Uncharacterized protein n=1 Tax=Petrolisthes cinctipes TaxID=88211 RepID=A0AAE1BH49_PETCI|nr:hypothetical protein Pcinc_042766 [Petrolisthes cinctipes]